MIDCYIKFREAIMETINPTEYIEALKWWNSLTILQQLEYEADYHLIYMPEFSDVHFSTEADRIWVLYQVYGDENEHF